MRERERAHAQQQQHALSLLSHGRRTHERLVLMQLRAHRIAPAEAHERVAVAVVVRHACCDCMQPRDSLTESAALACADLAVRLGGRGRAPVDALWLLVGRARLLITRAAVVEAREEQQYKRSHKIQSSPTTGGSRQICEESHTKTTTTYNRCAYTVDMDGLLGAERTLRRGACITYRRTPDL